MVEQPSFVLIVPCALEFGVASPVAKSNTKPAPLPKYQLEASPCAKPYNDIVVKSRKNIFFIYKQPSL